MIIFLNKVQEEWLYTKLLKMLTVGLWNVIIIQAESTITYNQEKNFQHKHLKLIKTLLIQR